MMEHDFVLSPSNAVVSASAARSTHDLLFAIAANKKFLSSGDEEADEILSPATAPANESRHYLARLTLQLQEISDRYELCLAHFQDAAAEADALRAENVRLRLINSELNTRLGILTGHRGSAKALADEFRRLSVVDPMSPPLMMSPDDKSPTSVMGLKGSGGGRRWSTEGQKRRPALPKSISIRSNGYLKLNQAVSATKGNVRSPGDENTNTQNMQKVYVGSGAGKKAPAIAATEDEGDEDDLELEVFNQGMFKTELCNKWEENADCPYGEHCQFAHGIGELRPVIRHPRYKTEICRMVLSGDSCPYGHRCHFRHSVSPSDNPLLVHP